MVKIVKGEVGLESLPEKVKADIYGKVMLKFLERMVEDAKKTKKDNMERAFAVCYSRERGFYATSTRLGTPTEVVIPQCEGGLEEMIGT
ncbi:hypothetical protein, partial [Escherichia coli]|uniref:hypothetical protein n=1 Tax=Escherichia coli TaxID=562 RepID=UPI00128F7580